MTRWIWSTASGIALMSLAGCGPAKTGESAKSVDSTGDTMLPAEEPAAEAPLEPTTVDEQPGKKEGDGASGAAPPIGGDEPSSEPEPQAATTDKTLSGKLSQAEILALVTKHNALFNDCYTLGAAGSEQFVATVTVKATISPSGKVAVAEIIKSTAKNPKVDACVAEAFKKMPFPQPADGATSVITFPMKFEGAEEIK